MCHVRHTRRACGQVAREPRFRGGHTLSGALDTIHPARLMPCYGLSAHHFQRVWELPRSLVQMARTLPISRAPPVPRGLGTKPGNRVFVGSLGSQEA